MKKLILLFLGILTILTSCSSNEDTNVTNTNITLNFTHTWDAVAVTKADFNDLKFENENGEMLSIERLRYLISNIYLKNSSGVVTNLSEYLLIDLGEEKNLTFSTENLLLNGTYNLYCTFGFSDDENYAEGGYPDLTTEVFDVPAMLGGGYHYMQFDGKYLDDTDTETGFNYHAIHATDRTDPLDPDNNRELDTSFEIDLGEIAIVDNKTTATINMNIEQWFTAPNTWDLNVLDQALMPKYDAQILMMENGLSVFKLVEAED